MNGRTRSTVALVAGALCIWGTCALGFWQLRRAAAKEATQASIVSAAAAAPMPLSAVAAHDTAALVHRHLRLEGRWLPERVVYLDNRPNAGRAGLYVLMPLRLAAPLAVDVIVNRGWLPRNAADRSRIAPYTTPDGVVAVTGIALAEEPRLLELTTPADRRLKGLWQNFDVAAFRAAVATGDGPASDAEPRDLLPIVVREDPTVSPIASGLVTAGGVSAATTGSAADGLNRDWPDRGAGLQGQIDRHHGYAFQWFALAATLAVLVVFHLARLFRHRRNVIR